VILDTYRRFVILGLAQGKFFLLFLLIVKASSTLQLMSVEVTVSVPNQILVVARVVTRGLHVEHFDAITS
jgi:hypothetical protein